MRQGRSACRLSINPRISDAYLHQGSSRPLSGRPALLLYNGIVPTIALRPRTTILPLSHVLSSRHQQRRRYARDVNERPYPDARRDKEQATKRATEADRGLAGLAQLETMSAVPAGRIAKTLEYALSVSSAPLITKRVLALIKKAEGKHRNDYALLASVLGKATGLSDKEKMGYAQALYDRMKQTPDGANVKLFDVAILSTLIKVFAAGGDWAKCEELMAHMREERIRPTVVTYTNLLKYCERVESWNKAAEVLERMKTDAGLQPDVVFYTSLINVCCKRNDLQQAMKVLAEMRSAEVKPNIFTYTSLINICEREKNLRKALELLEEMKNEKIEPNVYIFTSLINVCEKKRDLNTAMTLFEEMTRLYKIRPNTFTFNSLLNVCVEKRDLDKGLEVLGMMRHFQIPPNTSSFNALTNLCAKTGNIAKGTEILDMMKTAGVPADNLTFTSLIAACRVRDEDPSQDLGTKDRSTVETPESESSPRDTVSPSLEKALSLLDRMRRDFKVAPDNITLTTLMSLCLRSKRLAYSLRAYGQVKAELDRNGALQLDKETYYELVNLCAKNGQWKRGLSIVDDMEKAGLVPSVRIYNSFLRHFDPIANIEDAKEVVRLMRSRDVEEDDTTKVLLRRLGIQPRHIGQILQQGPRTASPARSSTNKAQKRESGKKKPHTTKP